MRDVRLTSRMLISAMIRRAEALGGHATVLSKGDETAGAIVVALAERGRATGLRERGFGPDGNYRWIPCGPATIEENTGPGEYLERRRRLDPDLWVVEFDVPQGEAILEDLIGML